MRRGFQSRSLPLIVERNGARNEQSLRAISPDDQETITHLLVTTKAYDVREAVAGVAHCLTKESVVVLLVNGMGLAEQLDMDQPHLRVYCGTTTAGAYCIAPQHIQHAGRGETVIGRQGEIEPPLWFNQWSRAIDSCLWNANIETALWSKLAVNCVINPLTAIHRCLNGELSQRPNYAAQVGALCDEVASVCRVAGFSNIAATLPVTVDNVIASTAKNRSSMLQDVEGNRETEIDYITGYLLQVAQQYGIDAPLNRKLMEGIKNRDR
jgi:2-dehydropantoate 2-reductase